MIHCKEESCRSVEMPCRRQSKVQKWTRLTWSQTPDRSHCCPLLSPWIMTDLLVTMWLLIPGWCTEKTPICSLIRRRPCQRLCQRNRDCTEFKFLPTGWTRQLTSSWNQQQVTERPSVARTGVGSTAIPPSALWRCQDPRITVWTSQFMPWSLKASPPGSILKIKDDLSPFKRLVNISEQTASSWASPLPTPSTTTRSFTAAMYRNQTVTITTWGHSIHPLSSDGCLKTRFLASFPTLVVVRLPEWIRLRYAMHIMSPPRQRQVVLMQYNHQGATNHMLQPGLLVSHLRVLKIIQFNSNLMTLIPVDPTNGTLEPEVLEKRCLQCQIVLDATTMRRDGGTSPMCDTCANHAKMNGIRGGPGSSSNAGVRSGAARNRVSSAVSQLFTLKTAKPMFNCRIPATKGLVWSAPIARQPQLPCGDATTRENQCAMHVVFITSCTTLIGL